VNKKDRDKAAKASREILPGQLSLIDQYLGEAEVIIDISDDLDINLVASRLMEARRLLKEILGAVEVK
jgi:hypothetical protein